MASIGLEVVVIAANLATLGMQVSELSSASGQHLLGAAMQTGLTNVVGFALLYWELDRGGPVARCRDDRSAMPAANKRFSQDENDGTVVEVQRTLSKSADWVPIFIDYAYLSQTNSRAFSQTDTIPLSKPSQGLDGDPGLCGSADVAGVRCVRGRVNRKVSCGAGATRAAGFERTASAV